jgi:threonine dehydrogenase-like Zn-dependent dehydrogenase
LDPDELAKRVREVTSGKGVDVGIEATGVPAVVKQAWELIAYLGTLLQVGTPGAGPTIPIEVRPRRESDGKKLNSSYIS